MADDPLALEPVEGLDPEIAEMVNKLRSWGAYTVQSCQGGPGHCRQYGFVQFHASVGQALRILGIVLDHKWLMMELRQVWDISDGHPDGPYWELTFPPPVPRPESEAA